MMKRKEFMLGAIAGLTFAAAATAGGVIDWPSANAGPVAGFSGRLSPNAGGAGLAFAPPQGAPRSFADIFEQVAPAVVQIEVKTRVQQRQRFIQIPGLGAVPVPPGAESEGEGEEAADGDAPTALGAGSGFFIAANGYIVTNNHVVADATEIRVKLADGREMDARLIGRDENTDLAVIKVEGTGYPFVNFEETAAPRVGDWVIAVGNPFGLGGTATAGIVSAQGRDVDSAYVGYLQIDAAINQGNSGGPTFDIYGRVIGVNSAIYSQTGGSVGIGFAIPASIAKPITDQLMRGESIERGYVGLGLRTFTPEQWEALGQAPDFKGAFVESVTAAAPAASAGIEIGDLLVAVNGQPVANGTEATRRVGASRPNETIRLDIIRDGRRRTINVRSGIRPPEAQLRGEDGGDGTAPLPGQPPTTQGEPVEGLSVVALTPALRARYEIPEAVTGVVITNVARGTPAARLGLQAGFVITRADNRAVASVGDLRTAVEAVKRAGRSGVLLFVRTPQGTVPTVLKFETE